MPDVAENKDLLVALVGKMHTGKSTMADALVRECGFTRLAFADPLKEVSAIMLTSFLSYMNDQTLRRPDWWEVTPQSINAMKGDPAIRKLLQLVGTELGRDWYGPDTIWIDLFEKRLRQLQGESDKVRIVIDDCRFPNEAEALKAMGFTIFRLHRNEDERLESIQAALLKQKPELLEDRQALNDAMEAMANHPSEREVDNINADFGIRGLNVEHLQKFIAPNLVYGLLEAKRPMNV